MAGLDRMKQRLLWTGGGGSTNDDRINEGKLRSLRAAINNSYQAETITFNGDETVRCLINRDKLSKDYDDKEISIEFKYGMKSGDIFKWNRTDTYWMVYLQRLEEEAYFRAQIRRCDYEIDINGNKRRVYIRGPVETDLIWNQKHKISFNEMNYSILMYIPKDEETNEFFKRFKKIKFDGHNWMVATVDRYSQGEILEVYLEESFDNEFDDAEVVDSEIIQDPIKPYIDGPQFIKPYDIKSYSIVNSAKGLFVVNSTKVKINKSDETSCEIEILTGRSTEFDLIYRVDGEEDIVLPITVKSL